MAKTSLNNLQYAKGSRKRVKRIGRGQGSGLGTTAGKGNKGQKSDISCACHWTVNNAAANNIGTMYGKAYVVTPGGIMVPGNSAIKRAEDLKGKEVAVGYQSGSHYTTIQALEPFMKPEDIKLKFVGTPWQRVDIAVDELDDRHRRVVAVAEARLEHARVAAVAPAVAGRQHVEELPDERHVLDLRDRLTARMQIAALAEGDQLFHDGPQVLRLRQRRGDLLVLDEGLRHVGEHRLAMLMRAVETTLRATVIHG